MSERIPITRPVIGPEEQAAAAAVLASGFLVQGPLVAEFERQVADAVGASHAIAVTNCTAALHLALLGLGVGPGDVVAVAPYSWVATANVIELCGATPLFVDVDRATFNMSADLLDAALGRQRVAAVMPVHTFGNPAGISALMAVAAKHGVPVVEDAACALGAYEDGTAAGAFGVASCFSFHPRKIITTGEGGMLVTSDDRLAAHARAYRNHGQEVVDGQVEFVIPGGNLRLTEIQGAIGVEQMRRLDGLVSARGELATRYDQLLADTGCIPQLRSAGAAVQSYVCLAPAGTAASDVIATLRAADVEATIGTNAIPFTRFYAQRYALTDADLPVTATLRDRAVTLPLFPGMTHEQQDRVVAVLREAVG
jgi:perosamine synthetase